MGNLSLGRDQVSLAAVRFLVIGRVTGDARAGQIILRPRICPPMARWRLGYRQGMCQTLGTERNQQFAADERQSHHDRGEIFIVTGVILLLSGKRRRGAAGRNGAPRHLRGWCSVTAEFWGEVAVSAVYWLPRKVRVPRNMRAITDP